MAKYRLCFAKDGPMIYVGHLDLLKLFQRAIKRAGLPIAYSAGFNPHQLISFALPLPIGYSAAADYAELVCEQPDMHALAAQMPNGLTLRSLQLLPPGERPAAALVTAALYEIELPSPPTAEAIAELLAADSLILPKKTKSGVTPTDIRPDILYLRADGNRLFAMLSAGSARNLKPELLTECLKSGQPLSVKRIDLFYKKNGSFVSLGDFS